MSHLLPTSTNETIGVEIGDYYLVFYNAFAQYVQSVEMLIKTLYSTQTGRDALLFASMIDPLFSGSRRIFFFR